MSPAYTAALNKIIAQREDLFTECDTDASSTTTKTAKIEYLTVMSIFDKPTLLTFTDDDIDEKFDLIIFAQTVHWSNNNANRQRTNSTNILS